MTLHYDDVYMTDILIRMFSVLGANEKSYQGISSPVMFSFKTKFPMVFETMEWNDIPLSNHDIHQISDKYELLVQLYHL